MNHRFNDIPFPNEDVALWWAETGKRRRFAREFGESKQYLFVRPWPEHIRGYWEESERHIKRINRFRLFIFLVNNDIPAHKARAYMMDNRELRRGLQDDYDAKAILDFNNMVKEINRVKRYPTFDAIAKKSQWDKPYGYLDR